MIEPFKLRVAPDIYTYKERETYRALEIISAQLDEWLKIYRSVSERMFSVMNQDPECKKCLDKAKENAH